MSKERLEYFHKRYEEEKDIARHAGITFTKNEFKWLLDYAKEQAERAQELGASCQAWQKRHDALEAVYKRYCKATEQIMSIMSHPFSKTWNKDKTLYKIDKILKALESESND